MIPVSGNKSNAAIEMRTLVNDVRMSFAGVFSFLLLNEKC
ncbi:hypothetical protein C817_00950 [Dorea sp. 5-2]|nr:hypothetical protein C817_00950 [Dorea sp. 5-2]